MLDAFELEVGWKLRVSEKLVSFVFVGSDTTPKLFFPIENDYFQGDTYNTLVLMYMLLFSEKRDSRNTFGLVCGLKSLGSCFCWLFWFGRTKVGFPK